MQRNNFVRGLLFLLLLTGLCAGLVGPRMNVAVKAAPVAQAATTVVISELRFRGSAGGNDEFIELYNPTNKTKNLNGWKVNKSDNTGVIQNIYSFTTNISLAAGQHFLLANVNYNDSVLPDATYQVSLGILDDGGVALIRPDNSISDQVGLSDGSAYQEGTPLTSLGNTGSSSIDRSYDRIGVSVNCSDSNDNSVDFFLRNPSDPQSSASGITTCGNPTSTPTPTGSATVTSTSTRTQTLTPTFTATPTSTTPPTMDVLISEVAWAGTKFDSNHEWIELYNPSSFRVYFTGWRLQARDGDPNINLSGYSIEPRSYFLLAKDASTFLDIVPDFIYPSGNTFSNSGETLLLYDGANILIDSANANGGDWPAGSASPNYATMERDVTLPDSDVNAWHINDGVTRNGTDGGGNPIWGTPQNSNIPTRTPTPTKTLTPTKTPTNTPTNTKPPTKTPTPAGTLSVIINEVAWMGTEAAYTDEWIELYNPGNKDVNLNGWKLYGSDGSPYIILSGTIGAKDYFVVASNSSVFKPEDLVPDWIYSFGSGLSNEGELLRLIDPSNKTIDTANADYGPWPAGLSSPSYQTMERRNAPYTDSFFGWSTYASTSATPFPKPIVHDRGGNIIKGTPGQSNWGITVTLTPTHLPTPTRTPFRISTPIPVGRMVINEFLPLPGFDWNQDGLVDGRDEFIEVVNLGPVSTNLSGWKLDDEANTGSSPYSISSVTLKPGEHAIFYGLKTNISLSDGGDTVRLLNVSNTVIDAHSYTVAKQPDQSWCRMPDGNGDWYDDCVPTPNRLNQREGDVPVLSNGDGLHPAPCKLPDTLPADFLFAECNGYGGNMWRSQYWDKEGWQGDQRVPSHVSKWESFVE